MVASFKIHSISSLTNSNTDDNAGIYNVSFESGIFPDWLNRAGVIPLVKTSDTGNIQNYRPVFLLPCFKY
jgi:hypothetical protein